MIKKEGRAVGLTKCCDLMSLNRVVSLWIVKKKTVGRRRKDVHMKYCEAPGINNKPEEGNYNFREKE